MWMSVCVILLAAVGVLCGAQQCRQSPLTIAGLAEDFGTIFPGLSDNVFLVERGTVRDLLQSQATAELLPLRDDITVVPLVWVSSVSGVSYRLRFHSLEPDVLDDPVISVNSSGILPDRPFRFHVYLMCLKEQRPGVPVRVEMNTTSPDGQPYCSVVFYFGKYCRNSISFLELGSGQVLDINDGFVNVSFFMNSTNDNMTVPVLNTHVDSLVSAVLVPMLLLMSILVVVVMVVWLTWYIKLRIRQKQLELVAVSVAFQQTHSKWLPHATLHHKEFPADNLYTRRQLGEGAFGVVYEGVAEGIDGDGQTIVAVKQLRSGGDDGAKEEFFREVAFMSRLDHPHVVRLLGVCSLAEPFSMIFEFMDLGDLCTYLREAIILGEDGAYTMLTTSELLSICLQVAHGAEYIASLNLVHRDLACRNCLISTGLVVKIADFGMSRNLYSMDYYKVQGSALLPLRWMAPESVLYGKFTESSDVWSYGVLTWEVFTFGQQPFAGHDNEYVLGIIQQGEHLDPPICPAHQLMLDCWEWSPKNRPTFNELRRLLTTLLHDQLEEEEKRSQDHSTANTMSTQVVPC